MCVVKFDTVESGCLRANGRIGEQTRQSFRKVTNMWQLCISNALPVSISVRFKLAPAQGLNQLIVVQLLKPLANLIVAQFVVEIRPMLIGDLQEALKIFFSFWPAIDAQKINNLN